MVNVSLFCSAVRPKIWDKLFRSLDTTSVSYEIVLCGNSMKEFTWVDTHARYYPTGNIKPSTCYEIARRNCIGEVVVWIADDCEFPNDVIGKSYRYWKSQNNEKLILSLQTKETGYKNIKGTLFDMNIHRFFGGDYNSPLMAPL